MFLAYLLLFYEVLGGTKKQTNLGRSLYTDPNQSQSR
jgi:hypothetical protein